VTAGKLCPNCESDRHARCCAWCGKPHKLLRLHHEHCSTKCDLAAAGADRLSAAMEEDPSRSSMTPTAFTNYLLDFYGVGGLYTEPGEPFQSPMTREEAERVTTTLSAKKTFEGDSFDREKARDLVLAWRSTPAESRDPG
jgi:hypothetical protein